MKNEEFTIGGDKYEIFHTRGRVAGATKNYGTSIDSSYMPHVSGTPVVSLTSSTTVYDQIFVENRHGEQRVIELQNWNVSVLQDHVITVLWIIKNNAPTGQYVAIQNETTGQLQWGYNDIEQLAGKPSSYRERNRGGDALMLFGGMGVGLLVLVGSFIGYKAAIIFLPVPAIIYLIIQSGKKSKAAAKAQVIRQNLQGYLKEITEYPWRKNPD